MYEDVLATLCAVDALQGVLVVTRDDTAAALAEKHGARVLREAENLGQTAAVEAAAAWLATCRWCRRRKSPMCWPCMTRARV